MWVSGWLLAASQHLRDSVGDPGGEVLPCVGLDDVRPADHLGEDDDLELVVLVEHPHRIELEVQGVCCQPKLGVLRVGQAAFGKSV